MVIYIQYTYYILAYVIICYMYIKKYIWTNIFVKEFDKNTYFWQCSMLQRENISTIFA